MKYLSIDPFENHLDEALPEHPSELYFILMEDPFERLFLAKRVAKRLALPMMHCTDESLLNELESPSLFDAKKVIICDQVTAKEISLSNDSILIITGKSAPSFFKKMEKEGVTLDLTGEKPWNRKSRLQRWLLEKAREGRKTLTIDGANHLLESSTDFATLSQELEKAIVYAGDEKTITLEMIQAICHLNPEQNGWELSESAIWGGPVNFGETDLYSLVGQLRYQLQLGLQIVCGNPPKISPKKLDKIQRKNLNSSYYLEGLQELFNLEMKLRSNLTNQELLFDHFRAKLKLRRDVISTS